MVGDVLDHPRRGHGVLAASGHCITARWAFAPVCGAHFWRVVLLSPEILIFLFFMITDPEYDPGRPGGPGRRSPPAWPRSAPC